MRKANKILALLLSVCLVMGMAPLTVFAEDAGQPGGSGEIIAADDPAATSGDAETPDSGGENGGDTPLGASDDSAVPTSTSPSSVTATDSDEQTKIITIAAFDKLPEETEWQNYDYGTVESLDDLTLPDTLAATDADGEALTVNGVTWESDPAFDPDTARAYWFSPALPDGYGLAEGVTAPMITVIIKPEGGARIQATAATGTFIVGFSTHLPLGVNANGSNWSWDAGSATLTLTGNVGQIAFQCAQEDVITLDVQSNVDINYTAGDYAITCQGSLEITGGGILTLIHGGLSAWNDLTVSAKLGGITSDKYGIYSSNGSVTLNGETGVISGGNYGIHSSGAININNFVTVTGGIQALNKAPNVTLSDYVALLSEDVSGVPFNPFRNDYVWQANCKYIR